MGSQAYEIGIKPGQDRLAAALAEAGEKSTAKKKFNAAGNERAGAVLKDALDAAARLRGEGKNTPEARKTIIEQAVADTMDLTKDDQKALVQAAARVVDTVVTTGDRTQGERIVMEERVRIGATLVIPDAQPDERSMDKVADKIKRGI